MTGFWLHFWGCPEGVSERLFRDHENIMVHSADASQTKLDSFFLHKKQFLSGDVLFPWSVSQCFGIISESLKSEWHFCFFFFLSVHTMVQLSSQRQDLEVQIELNTN